LTFKARQPHRSPSTLLIVTAADEAVNYPTEFFECTRCATEATVRTAVENRRVNYYVTKYQPAKTLEQHAAYSEKINSNVVKQKS
ncbi:unnamed protein product, partial [Onchocerca ochengi]